MPINRGVHVWLEVDDKPLEEFKVTVEDKRIQCYVPSEEGKRFLVKFKAENVTHIINGFVYLDGASVAGKVVEKSQLCTIKGCRTNMGNYLAPFLFSRLRTTDNEDEACHDESRIRELGSVRVRIEWVYKPIEVPYHSSSSGLPQSIAQPIWEKTKKGSQAGHSVVFGDFESTGPRRWVSTHRIPHMPVIDFIFRYGPIDWLRAEGIAPSLPMPSPPPPPLPSTGPPANRNDEHAYTSDEEKENHELVKRKKSPTMGDWESDIDGLSPEEEAEYRRLKAKMKARKRFSQTNMNARGELQSPPSKRRKSTLKFEPDEDRKPRFPIVRQDNQEYIDLTVDD